MLVVNLLGADWLATELFLRGERRTRGDLEDLVLILATELTERDTVCLEDEGVLAEIERTLRIETRNTSLAQTSHHRARTTKA